MRLKVLVLVSVLATLALAFASPPAAHASGLTFFSDKASFEFSAPGLPVEDFETSLVTPGNIIECNRPLNTDNDVPTQTAPNGCFQPQSLKPGITYTTMPSGADPGNPNGYDPALAAIGKNVFQSPSIYLGANWNSDWLVLQFTNPANSVGFSINHLVSPQTCTIDVYDASGLKGSTTTSCSTSFHFWGVQSDTQITQIVVKSPVTDPTLADGFEGVDNIEFGLVDFTTTTAHPAILDTSGPTVYLTLSATLTRGTVPLIGQSMEFEIGGSKVCSGTTDATGTASCGGVPEILGVALSSSMTYTAKFKGGGGFGPSSGSAGLIA